MSQCIYSLTYEEENQQLTIVFQERGTYLYYDVSIAEYLRLEAAGSQGLVFNNMIRDIKYFERIG